jgi:hypothetical protein
MKSEVKLVDFIFKETIWILVAKIVQLMSNVVT